MTFTEWLALRRRSSAAEIANMRQLEAWEAGRRELQSELEPMLSAAKELAGILERAFSEGSWVGAPEALAEARGLGLLGKSEHPLQARRVQTNASNVVGKVLFG